MPLKPELIKTIWAAAREHGVDRDGVHEAIAAGWPGKTSVKDLTDAQACQLLDGIRGKRRERQGHGPYERRLAMRDHGRRKTATGGTDYLVNAAELEILASAARARGMDEARLRGFCQRQIQLDAPRTMREYNKVLWGLKAMTRRAEGPHAA